MLVLGVVIGGLPHQFIQLIIKNGFNFVWYAVINYAVANCLRTHDIIHLAQVFKFMAVFPIQKGSAVSLGKR